MTLDLELHADTDVWIGLPVHWSEDTFPDHAAWAREAAEAVWSGTAPEPGRGPGPLALLLAMHVERLPLQADFRRTWFWIPEPDVDVLHVSADLFAAEDDEDEAFAELAEMHQPAVEPPVVEPFDFPHLGRGRSLTRWAAGEDGDLYVARHLFVRAQGHDLHVHLATHDTARAARAMPDVEELARAARLVEVPS